MPNLSPATHRIAAATLVLGIGLGLVGWLDHRATRQDLLGLLVEQAVSLRHSVAAAARAADAASAQAQSALTARLLDNARLLERLDRARALDQPALDAVARAHRLYRVTVFSSDGARQLTAGRGGPPAGAGRGFGPGPGGGPGSGTGTLADQLLTGSVPEAVSEVHGNRWGRGWRLAAGVRRSAGGAIVLNVDAADVVELGQAATLDHVLSDIAAGAPEVAYVLLEEGGVQAAHGRLAEAAASAIGARPAAPIELPGTGELAGLAALEWSLAGTDVLEFAGPVSGAALDGPQLRFGLSLDSLRRAERRSLTRLALLLLAALGLGAVGMAFVALRREHGVLRERHAQAEEALRRRDRLAAMGELASTVAHEVRNPLNAIGMSVQRLRREFSAPAGVSEDPAAADEHRQLLDVLSSETSRINRIVQQFLDFARPPRLVPVRIDLPTLLTDVAAATRAFADERGVALNAEVSAAGMALADPDLLKQAIGNLLRNAIEASSAGAAVTLRAATADGEHRVEVEDRGPGIPPGDVPRIFDLYFTRKAGGSGIGLAVTHQIVDAHGGRIEVDTESGRGTRMRIVWPGHGEG